MFNKKNFHCLIGIVLIASLSCKRNHQAKNINTYNSIYNKVIKSNAKLSQLFNSYKFILLENKNAEKEQIIGKISKLIVLKNRIIIFDDEITNRIFVYDTLGNFIFRTKKGEGPKEVREIDDFSLDEDSGRLLVLDNGNRSIKIFSLVDGRFIKMLPTQSFFNGIEYMGNDEIILMKSHLTDKNKYSIDFKFIKISASNEIHSNSIILGDSSSYLYYASGYSSFVKSDTALYFSPAYSSKIYMISKSADKISRSLTIDFGKNSLLNYSDKIKGTRDFNKYLGQVSYITGCSLAISDDYIILPVSNHRSINYLFINKNLKSCKAYKHIDNNLYEIPIIAFQGSSYDGKVYTVIPPALFKAYLNNKNFRESMRKNLGKDYINLNIINPILVELSN